MEGKMCFSWHSTQHRGFRKALERPNRKVAVETTAKIFVDDCHGNLTQALMSAQAYFKQAKNDKERGFYSHVVGCIKKIKIREK